MMGKRISKMGVVKLVFGALFAMVSLLGGMTLVYAEENNGGESSIEVEETEEKSSKVTVNTENTTGKTCQESMGPLGWLVCPATGKISEAVDWLYDKIEEVLVINPVEMKDGAPIYEIWKYMRGITNIVFIIFLIVMVYSQITGLGISNYGLKKTLPKLIVGAILVNLSFVICSLAVDASNVIGNGLRNIFTTIGENAAGTMEFSRVNMSQIYSGLGGSLAGGMLAGAVALETGTIWMLIPTVLGAIVAVAIGLITIALRQAVVALLIMIAPLAVVAYILPNTEQWFKKWRQLLFKMLVFYPAFSLLFGASSLAGFAIIASAKDGFGVCLGIAVQIFPLFFAWSLMKMSGTFLSTINTKLTALAARPLAVNRAWAESKKMETGAYYAQYGQTPSSHLRRYLDNRRTLREAHTANLQGYRKNEAGIYAQKRIAAGYDGTKALGTSGNLKPNRYTRAAKDFSNSNLAVATATADTKHVLSDYGNYFVDENTRKLISQLTRESKSKDEEKAMNARRRLEQIRAVNPEAFRAATGATNYLEFSRAKMTEENDNEADFNFMVDEFVDATVKNIGDDDKRVVSEAERKRRAEKYKHYIMSSAGGLGAVGQVRVLGKIIAQAAAVESSQRRDINIVAAKFPPDKSNFRNMLVGFRVNDDGYAVDEVGNVIEDFRGQLLKHDPDKLILWDKVDENGPYFDWYDTNGNYVTRIYKSDKSAIKELLSNYDATINDPINNLYGILAGIKEGDITGENENLKYIGLDAFRTTVGRAILNAPFKDKNAAFSPMVAEMINKGYIKNYAIEYLAYLDSLNKATKPGAFNVQDADAVAMFTRIMDPSNWDEIFTKDLVKEFKNVNGKPLTGLAYEYDEAGNRRKVEIPFEEATQEQIMEKIKDKFLFPAAQKMMVMMSRQTQNTSDNQKAGTIKEWKHLKDIFDNKWGNDKVGFDPYKQAGDMRSMAWEIQDELYSEDEEGNRTYVVDLRRRKKTERRGDGTVVRDEAVIIRPDRAQFDGDIDEILVHSAGDAEFEREFGDYCSRYPGMSELWAEFELSLGALRREYRIIPPERLRDLATDLFDRNFPDI